MYLTTMGVVNKTLTIMSRTEKYETGSLEIDQIQFNFNGEEWEGLSKVAVFVADNGKVYEIPLLNDSCTIPYEAYISSKIGVKNIEGVSSIAVGVYGILIEGDVIQKVHPTNLVSLPLEVGSYFQGVTPSNLPTADQWQIYIQTVSDLVTSLNSLEFYLDPQTGDLSYSMD